jgi:hypothetical protein
MRADATFGAGACPNCCVSDPACAETSDSHLTGKRACSADLGANLRHPPQLREIRGTQIGSATENSAPEPAICSADTLSPKCR